jgi:hypothetical protein
MKIANIIKITGLIFISFSVIMTKLSFTIGNEITNQPEYLSEQDIQVSNLSNLGYKPVPDTCLPVPESRQTGAYVEDTGELNDNFLYKDWCEKTFDNGNYIYEAYKNITFNIKYSPDPLSTDFWQTPLETTRLKKGDCEDVVFHFFSKLPPNQNNAEIVWGWVIDRKSEVGRAHVWYQLIDKQWQKYIVEGFSKDWKGIIPMGIVENTETRKPILTISHSMVSRLSSLLPEVEEWNMCKILVDLFTSAGFISHIPGHQFFLQGMSIQLHLSDLEYIEYPANSRYAFLQDNQSLVDSPGEKIIPNMDKNICDIFKKLREVFSRYKNQKGNYQSKDTGLL